MSNPTPPTTKPNPRLLALAAAEARLKGSLPPSDPTPEQSPKEEKWEPPSEDDDRSKKRELARILDRGIVRDNGYKETSECVATLLKISNNIIANPSEPKYRTLKSTNPTLKTKILNVKGGHDFLIQLGFRTQTIDFTLNYVLLPSMRKLHELKLGAEVLQERVTDLSSRSTSRTTSDTLHKSDEAQRKARALREIEADRQLVKDRVERERINREARERVRLEKEREAAESAEKGEERDARGEEVEGEVKEEGEGEDEEDGGMEIDGGGRVPGVAMLGASAFGELVGGGTKQRDGKRERDERRRNGDYRPGNRDEEDDGYYGGEGRVLGKKDE